MDGMIEVIGEEACMSRKNRVRLHAKLSHFPTINNYIAAMSATVQRISKKTQSLTKKLERLRNGPLAISLPSKVKEVEMQFAFRNRDYGARWVYKHYIIDYLLLPLLICSCTAVIMIDAFSNRTSQVYCTRIQASYSSRIDRREYRILHW